MVEKPDGTILLSPRLKLELREPHLPAYLNRHAQASIGSINGVSRVAGRPEMTSKAMFLWSQSSGVKLHFIQPGKPTQNAFVESFNGRFRDNCLNQHWLTSLEDAREIVDAWRMDYNQIRPRSALNYPSPNQFEQAVYYGFSLTGSGYPMGRRSNVINLYLTN